MLIIVSPRPRIFDLGPEKPSSFAVHEESSCYEFSLSECQVAKNAKHLCYLFRQDTRLLKSDILYHYLISTIRGGDRLSDFVNGRPIESISLNQRFEDRLVVIEPRREHRCLCVVRIARTRHVCPG